ncbi:MAG: HlyD family secretion protein [Isosphaeraceae bacterium]
MKLKTFLRRALLLVIAGVAAFAAYQWWRLAHKSPVPEGIVFGNGRIESVQVDIAAKYGGRIKEIRVREGDLVETDQVLATMDIGEFEAQLANDKAIVAHDQEAASEVKAEIAKRETELKFADLEYNRSRGLFSRKAIAREEYDLVESKLETAKATLAGAKAKLRTAEQAINAAEADVKQTQVKIDDSTLKSPVRGRVLYRLAEPGEVVALGGKLLTLINLNDIYMEVFLPAQEAARVKIGADARIVLDARPGYAAPAKASYVSPEAQFTPKQVETRSERDKLMFRVKLKVPAEIVLPFIERIKTGVRGIGYVRLDDTVAWPDFLEKPFPKP